MSERRIVLGLDYGTKTARALLVDPKSGDEIATAVAEYPHGVLESQLPDGTSLEADTALQNPRDYLTVLQQIVPEVLNAGGVQSEEVIGIGVDFTASSVLPTLKDGSPLCTLPEFSSNPYAWVKLWKDHAALPEAQDMTELAERRGETFLSYYGGRLFPEWMFPKTLRMLRMAPEVYTAADRLIEAGDWLVWQLCGEEKRSACQAGYKGLWSKSDGFPSEDYLGALHPEFATFAKEKLPSDIYPVGSRAGGLRESWARKIGLSPGIPIAVAMIDAHAAVLGSTVAETGKMVLALGTSTCHLVMHEKKILAGGIAGIVEDGIVPGLVAYESGQSAVGDIFAWFTKNQLPAHYHETAKQTGQDVFSYLQSLAAQIPSGQTGLLALDWWNGNRSTLMDASLSGLIMGLTLATRPEDIYRALIEATAFGTNAIIDNHTEQGIPVNELYACGGLSERNQLLLQIYADVTGRRLNVAASSQAAALGSAICGAVAAGPEMGGHATFSDATRAMARVKDKVYSPDPSAHAIFKRLYAEYLQLYETFGRGALDTMKRLREIRREAGS